MPINVVRGTNDKPAASAELARILSTHPDWDGELFIGYPIIGTPEGPYTVDALLVSEQHGVVAFDLVEAARLGDHQSRQDDIANKLEARLRTYSELTSRRKLLVDITPVSYAPRITQLDDQSNADYPVGNNDTIAPILERIEWPGRSTEIYDTVLSAIESIRAVRRNRAQRTIVQPTSRGAKLKRLEESISTLDNAQSHAVIETADGIQRIRGLAGSGKTIVLALKAAYLHALHPEWRIAVTFNTRSLKGLFRRLIHNFVLQSTSNEPDWQNLRIVNAWGAAGNPDRDGIYFEFCRIHNVDYHTVSSAREHLGGDDLFAAACAHATDQAAAHRPVYDAILVDEAQDLPPEFLRLCHMLLKAPGRLIYAYDELQSLSGFSLPSPEHIFDQETDAGRKSVPYNFDSAFGQHDIILDRCYRHSRPVLTTAHAIGFGIYRHPPDGNDTGLIQMFDQADLWTEMGYEVSRGKLQDGSPVTLRRTLETSPKFLEEHSGIDDLIQFTVFDDPEEQDAWLAQAIKQNLQSDELRHDDIMVINANPRTTRASVGRARRKLFEMEINSHLAGVDTDPDVFFRNGDESITFTGVHRAKGNEAGMVYIINAQECHSSEFNLATLRNRLFTAITRSKAWIRVFGVGPAMADLSTEYERLQANDFELNFNYPTQEQRQRLRLVHRDMTDADRKQVEAGQKHLHSLLRHLESGSLRTTDLDPDVVARLKGIL